MLLDHPDARVLRSRDGAWVIGWGGLAQVPVEQLTAGGAPNADAVRALEAEGILGEPPADEAYSLTVLTTTKCNLGCGYCYQNTESYSHGNPAPERIEELTLVDDATLTKLVDFVSGRMEAAGLTDLSLLLFGGEPLLNYRGCCRLLTNLADSVDGDFDAWMISNATLLSQRRAAELESLGLSLVQVSFDGRRERHDVTRITRRGEATYDRILDNLAGAEAATDRLHFEIRIQVLGGIGEAWSVLDDLTERVQDPSRFTPYVTPVMDVGVGYPIGVRSTEKCGEELTDWTLATLARGFAIAEPAPRASCATCG